ncbi:hypothetical protein [Streptosporangium sandarakinum]|uniref:hypothetical protein n=1 Tax=Streptosporangium sandarakinum TaxID=1260955 RepID=UPI00342B0072
MAEVRQSVLVLVLAPFSAVWVSAEWRNRWNGQGPPGQSVVVCSNGSAALR